MSKLYAGRFSGSTSNGTMLENFGEVQRLGIRWNIERYGIERIEVTVKAKTRIDISNRMKRHFGGLNEYIHRIGVFDNTLHKCVSGQIIEIRPEDSSTVTYITRGPIWLLETSYGPLTLAASTDTTTDQLLNYLTEDTPRIGSDLTGVEETSTPLGGWQPEPVIGTTVSEFIKFAKESGNSAGGLWDFYLVDEPMNFGSLKEFKPYFRNRTARTDVDWRVSIADLSGLTLGLGMHDFRSAATVYYGTYTGTATSGGNATTLNNTSESFLNGRFSVGDEIRNLTDGSTSRIREIASNTQILTSTLSGGSDNLFSTGDSYSIKAGKIKNFETSNDGIFNHESRILIEILPELNETQAAQYAAALEDFYKIPVQSAAFTISSPTIRDANGVKRPLWAPIFEGGGLIQITDLYPAGAVSLNQGTNNLDTFFITTMDYDYTTNQLRVSVNVPDSRLDAKLKAARILGSEMIARGD